MGKPNVNINVGGAANGTQTYKTVVLKPNIPFAQQLGSEDTIYVIKWDYDLGGEEVNVPANCVLKFEGGSLSNGIVISNNTKVYGDSDLHDVDTYGAFFDENKNLYSYTGEKGIKFNTAVKTVIDVTNAPTYNQGIQAAANYDNYYIIATSIPGQSSNTGGIVLYDENFTVVKRGVFEVETHNNSACVKDNYCYVVARGGYIHRFNISSFINSADEEENIIPVYTYDLEGRALGALCYDERINKFINFGYSVGKVWYFDTNFNLTNEYEVDFYKAVEDKLGKPGGSYQFQDAILLNGIVYYGGRLLSSTGSNTYYNFIVAFDLVQNKIVDVYKIDDVFPYLETEGFTYNVKNHDELIIFCNSATNVKPVISLSFSRELNTGLQFRAPGNTKLGISKIANTTLFVNNAYEGVSDGTSQHPFKSIKEALTLTPITGLTYIRLVKNEGKPYREGTINLNGSCNVFFEAKSNSARPEIEIDLKLNGSTVEMKYMNFIGNSHIQGHLGRILVRQSDINITAGRNFILAQSVDLYLENVNANSGNAFVELDDTISAASTIHIDNLYVGCTSLLLGKYDVACKIYPIIYRYNTKGIVFGENSYAFQRGAAVVTKYVLPLYVYYPDSAEYRQAFLDEVAYLSQHINADVGVYSGSGCNEIEIYLMSALNIDNNPLPMGMYSLKNSTNAQLAKVDGYNGNILRLTNKNGVLGDWLFKYIGQLFLNSVTNDFGYIGTGQVVRRYDGSLIESKKVGTSAERPLSEYAGFQYFDTTLGKPIYYTGDKWVDANGDDVDVPA